MRNFKALITLNVPQKCSVKYYTNAEMLKISKKIVQSVEYSPRPEKETFTVSFFFVLGYFNLFLISQTFSKLLYICVIAFNFTFNFIFLNVIIAFKFYNLEFFIYSAKSINLRFFYERLDYILKQS